MKRIIGLIVSIIIIVIIFFPMINSQSIEKNVNKDIQGLIINENESNKAIAYSKIYNSIQGRFVKTPLGELSIDDAYNLRDELLNLEQSDLSSIEVIKQQIKLFEKYSLLDENKIPKYITNFLNQNDIPDIQPNSFPTVLTDVIICGPSVCTTLCIGSVVIPITWILLGLIDIPNWFDLGFVNYTNHEILGGLRATGMATIQPMYAGFAPSLTFTNLWGAVMGPRSILSPLVMILAINAGFSISVHIFYDSFPLIVFDWMINTFATGLIAYVSQIQPN